MRKRERKNVHQRCTVFGFLTTLFLLFSVLHVNADHVEKCKLSTAIVTALLFFFPIEIFILEKQNLVQDLVCPVFALTFTGRHNSTRRGSPGAALRVSVWLQFAESTEK